MPYSEEHKQKSREKILESASRLFSRRGYEAVSIDELMLTAGMTRGAFYNHFSSKAHVYAEAINHVASKSPVTTDLGEEQSANEWFGRILSKYLSNEHINHAAFPCPLAFLVSDVGNGEAQVRRAYTQVYQHLVQTMQQKLPMEKRGDSESLVMAVTTLMIGGVAVGRALDDPAVTERLLESCLKAAEALLQPTTPE